MDTRKATCSRCGSEHEITEDESVNLPAQIQDDVTCKVCKAVLFTYNSTSHLNAKLTKRGEWPKKTP